MNDSRRTPLDTSAPKLLMVSVSGVLVAVVGVVVTAQTSATAAMLAGIIVVLVGTATVAVAISRQLDDADGQQLHDPHEHERVRS